MLIYKAMFKFVEDQVHAEVLDFPGELSVLRQDQVEHAFQCGHVDLTVAHLNAGEWVSANADFSRIPPLINGIPPQLGGVKRAIFVRFLAFCCATLISRHIGLEAISMKQVVIRILALVALLGSLTLAAPNDQKARPSAPVPPASSNAFFCGGDGC